MADDIDERFQIDERFKDDEFDREFDQKPTQPVFKSFQRFDPDDPRHLAWMEANKDDVLNGKKSKAFDVEAFNDEIETNDRKVIEGQFYEVDRSFAKELQQMLAEKSNGSTEKFSFLSMIGKAVEPKVPEQEPIVEMPKFKPKKLEQDDIPEPSTKPKERTAEKPYFFVDTKDKQFLDVLNSFSCQQKINLIRKKWETDRERIIKKYKTIHKDATRQKERDQAMEARKRKRTRNNQNKNKKKKNKKPKVET